MKRFAAVLLFLIVSSTVSAETTQRYVVATRASVPMLRATAMLRDVEGAVPSRAERDITAFQTLNGFAADLTATEAAALRKSADVRYVEEVVERHALDFGTVSANDVSNPFAQTVPYGIDLVRAREVWPVTRGEGINVVVVDTGIDTTHPDLKAVFAGGYNTYDKSDNPLDDNGHGTHVSGTIAAADNNIGVVGVAPNVKLYVVKVLNASGSGTTDKIIAALDWILAKKNAEGGNWVANFSLGASAPSTAEREAFRKIIEAGVLIVAASGNESTPLASAPVGYPAAYAGVLAVGAVDSARALGSFSNQGPELGIVAPGVNVLSTVRVGSGAVAGVQSSAGQFAASELELSKRGTLSAAFVNCGIGRTTDFTSSVAGKIALIQRGTLTFNEKAHNAINAGAAGVIIYNNVDDPALNFTLKNDADPGAASFNWPIVIAISQADGQRLAASGSGQITITARADDYNSMSGTSMATPHAVGVVALVWSAAPSATAANVIQTIERTATDLGAGGFDQLFGNGLADALSAATSIAPAKFGHGGTPEPVPTTRRRSAKH